MTPAAPPLTRRPLDRRVLVLVSAVVLVEVCFYSALTPLLPSYVAELGLSTTQAGLLSGSYALSGLIAAIPCGWLAARIGARTTLIGGLVLLAGSSVAFAFGSTFLALGSARFVQGIAGAAAWAAGLAWLVEVGPRERRAQMIGTVLGTGIAGAIGGPVLGGLAHALGPRLVFSAVGAVVLALAAAVVLTRAGGQPQPIGDLRPALRNRRVVAGAWLTTLPTLMFGAAGVLVPLRLTTLGTGAAGVAAVFLVAAAAEAAASPLVGRVADRRGRLVPVRFGLVGVVLSGILLPLPQKAWLLAVVTVAGAAVSGVLLTPASALLSDGAEAAGAPQALVFGLFNLAWAVGQVLGSAGGARLADATSDAVPYLTIAVLALLTLVLLSVLRRGDRRALPAS